MSLVEKGKKNKLDVIWIIFSRKAVNDAQLTEHASQKHTETCSISYSRMMSCKNCCDRYLEIAGRKGVVGERETIDNRFQSEPSKHRQRFSENLNADVQMSICCHGNRHAGFKLRHTS